MLMPRPKSFSGDKVKTKISRNKNKSNSKNKGRSKAKKTRLHLPSKKRLVSVKNTGTGIKKAGPRNSFKLKKLKKPATKQKINSQKNTIRKGHRTRKAKKSKKL